MGRARGAGRWLVRRVTRRTAARTCVRWAVRTAAARASGAGLALLLLVWLTLRVSPWAALAAVALWAVGPVLLDLVCELGWLWMRARRVAAVRAARAAEVAGYAAFTDGQQAQQGRQGWPVEGVSGPQIRPAGEIEAGRGCTR